MRQNDWIKVAIVRPGNVLHIMNFITKVSKPNDNGIDVIMEVEPTPENIENEIRRAGGNFIEWQIIEQEDLPIDRTYRDAWTLENGKIVVNIEKATPIAMNNLRNERNQLLQESDVYVLPDRWNRYTPQKQNEWSTYRQELRDLPENTQDPFNPVWPEIPA